MTQELSIRVRALINDMFSFDRPRALIITDEITDLLSKENRNWDRMDGLAFTRSVYRAMGTLEAENPSLFL